MINILDNGKYRPRTEWSSNSIPSLVNIEEQNCSDEENGNHLSPPSVSPLASSPSNGLPPKSPRRGSFTLGLFGGKSSNDKPTKRRSSIAVSFLGRRESHKITKEQSSSYESAVKTEKSDASIRSPEIIFTSHTDDVHTTTVLHENDSKSDIRYGFFENNSNSQNIIDKNDSEQIEKESTKNRGRMRRMSWQTKLERRKKKNNYDLAPPKQLSPDDARCNSFDSKRKNSNGDIPYKTDEETGEDGEENDNGANYYRGGGGDGDGDDDIPYRQRQKRHSWWNIFVPDHIKNRSKSRSVDHGLATPFDLDSLRSKVEGRFESVDRLTKDADKLKKSSLPTIPTKTYTVRNCDTLTSVAAHFDTTPSELTHLNRLNSNFIYPGQQLLVPDKSNLNKDDSSSTTGSTGDGCGAMESSISGKSSPIERKLSGEVTSDEKDILDGLRPGSPKPGHIERVQTKSDDQIITQRFLKINVRHITDGQGVVAGVLLVTPNAVMFDPNVSDPLVIEHGPESYGVIAPMELVVNAAIFNDIAHMRVAGSNASNSICQEKVEIYYPKSIKEQDEDDENDDKNDDQQKDGGNRLEGTQSPGKDSLLVKDETFPELGGSVETCDDQESIASSGREGDAFPKAFDRDRVTPVSGEQQQIRNEETKDSTKTEDGSETNDKSGADTRNTIEDRRKSLLDHHWAIPNKDRASISNSRRSSEDDGDPNENVNTSALIAAAAAATNASIDQTSGGWRSSIFAALEGSATNSRSNSIGGNSSNGRRRSSLNSTTMPAAYLAATAAGLQPPLEYDDGDRTSQQSDEYNKSYYDSGIDIRDPIPIVPQIPTKKVYSDADIVLSNDWVPPRTISPVLFGSDTSPSKSGSISGPSSSGIGPSIISQTQSLDAGGVQRKKTSSVSFSVDENNEQQQQQQPTTTEKANEKKNKMLKRLSYPLTWVEGLTGENNTNKGNESTESAPNTGDSNQSVFSKVFSRRSSIGTFMRTQSSSDGTGNSTSKQKSNTQSQPKLDYRSMVSIDDMPELFVSFDKLIPRPARACQDPPLYLRLRMGKPIGKAIPLPTSVMSYGKNKLRPEYWFSVPKNRTDELYRFINTWVPHLYGELNEDQIKERGFELIQHDTEWTKNGSPTKINRTGSSGDGVGEDLTELTRESWEVLSMSTDDYRKASLFATGSFDLDFPIPELIGETEILTEEHREKLCGHLPARAEGYSWTLVFNTSQHGFSLNSLYRKMQRLESPILIVIEDTDHNVFGALTSCSLHVSDHFYGTGESLLYKFNPSFKVFHWTGENLYFIKGNPESLSIGAGDGRFGLWLDGDLNQGRSSSCSTYGNEPLAPQEDFVIKTLECWAFV